MSKVDLQERNSKQVRRETGVRADLARRGWRLMHRRNGQYWIMLARPMSLDELETFTKLYGGR